MVWICAEKAGHEARFQIRSITGLTARHKEEANTNADKHVLEMEKEKHRALERKAELELNARKIRTAKIS